MLSDLWYRFRALVFGSRMDRELDQELQFHLEQEIEKLRRAGVPQADAERRARLSLGGVAQVAEHVRDARGLGAFDRLTQDARYALRVLRRTPAFTLAVVLTLGVGIGATTTMFAVIDGLIFRALPYPNADRLVQIGATFGPVQVDSPAVRRYLGTVLSSISTIDFDAIRSRSQALEHVAGARGVALTATLAGEPRGISGAAVSASFFDLLGAHPIHGAGFTAAHDRLGAEPVAVLSYGLWQEHFGSDPQAVGRSITLDQIPHVVIGVLPRSFRGPDALELGEAQVFIPIGRVLRTETDRDNTSVPVLARLSAGRDVPSALTELDGVAASLAKEHPGSSAKFWVESLSKKTIGDSRSLWLLFGAVCVLLVIACANVANLFMVRATERTREIAVRVAMGAGRGRVARQLLTESAVFGLAGGALGLLLAWGGVQVFAALAPTGLARVDNVALDLRVFAFALALSLIASVFFGLAPARDAARSDIANGLRDAAGSLTAGKPRVHLRRALVVGQTTLALVLLVCGGLLVNSLARLARVELGFDPSNVAYLDVPLPPRTYPAAAPEKRTAFFSELLSRVQATAGVTSAALITGRPLGGGNFVTSIAAEGRLPQPGEQPLRVPFHVVSSRYFETLAIPVIEGRDFDNADTAQAPGTAIVSRAFAGRLWPGERSVVGKRFWMGRVAADAPLTTVVGVVEDIRHYRLEEDSQPMLYRAIAQLPQRQSSMVVRHQNQPAEMLQTLRRTTWQVDGTVPLERYGTMDGAVRAALGEPLLGAVLFGTFSAIAVGFACVGLYGTLAWLVRARRREMGIRLALGATAPDLVRMIIRQGLRLAAIGIALGVVAAAFASSLLSPLLYGVGAGDVPTFVAVAALMVIVAALACYLPARRAGRVDPAEILRDS